MSKMEHLEQLRPITDEMLSGLHADEKMRLAIRRAAAEKRPAARRKALYAVPALCAAVLLCTLALPKQGLNLPSLVNIQNVPAGELGETMDMIVLADLGAGARIAPRSGAQETLFAEGETDIPMLSVDGRVFCLLRTPEQIGESLLDEELGSIAYAAQEPSLAEDAAFMEGLSNAVPEGESVYAIKGLSPLTAVAARVEGKLRVFQRVSYAGRGPGGTGLEDVFDVRHQVRTLELSGVGTLDGEAANAAIDVLLDRAMLVSADAFLKGQTLTATLESGLKLQLVVSGDTIGGCGSWSCPEFFEAFENALEK